MSPVRGHRAGDATWYRFAITDTGVGVTAATLEKLFVPFSQADASTTRQYGDTGLGLAISKHLAELMGGAIGADSTPGKGSTFWFEVPLGPAANDGALLNTVTRLTQKLPAMPETRILVTDDNETNRAVVQGMLQSLTVHVNTADSAMRGIEILTAAATAADSRPYAIAIVDMMMPEVDGIEMVRSIRANPRLAATKVIMLTSAGGGAERSVARESGVDIHLTKPVRRSELLKAISTVLSNDGTPLSAHSPVTAPPAVADTPTSSASPMPRKIYRLLLAEDNLINQQIAIAMLKPLMLDIQLVSNGAQAVASVQSADFDLVLMDCQMPELDGFQATRQIRQQYPDRILPIIALTANAMEGDRERCIEAGMDDYLAKPFRKEQLFQIVHKWMPMAA